MTVAQSETYRALRCNLSPVPANEISVARAGTFLAWPNRSATSSPQKSDSSIPPPAATNLVDQSLATPLRGAPAPPYRSNAVKNDLESVSPDRDDARHAKSSPSPKMFAPVLTRPLRSENLRRTSSRSRLPMDVSRAFRLVFDPSAIRIPFSQNAADTRTRPAASMDSGKAQPANLLTHQFQIRSNSGTNQSRTRFVHAISNSFIRSVRLLRLTGSSTHSSLIPRNAGLTERS